MSGVFLLDSDKINKLEQQLLQLERRFENNKRRTNGLLEDLTLSLNELRMERHFPSNAGQEQVDTNNGLEIKLHYLKSVNDQMFNQNQRLRNYIEQLIREQKKPTQAGYYQALKGDD